MTHTKGPTDPESSLYARIAELEGDKERLLEVPNDKALLRELKRLSEKEGHYQAIFGLTVELIKRLKGATND